MHVSLDQLGGPIGLTVYIGALAIAGFVLPLRGLPWWYQTLTGIAAALAVAGLWLTCLADPGVIPAEHEPGARGQVELPAWLHTHVKRLAHPCSKQQFVSADDAYGMLVLWLSADVVVQQLEAGAAVPEPHLYCRDARGVWMRHSDQGRTAAYSKYCTTCNIWCAARQNQGASPLRAGKLHAHSCTMSVDCGRLRLRSRMRTDRNRS